MHSELTEGVLAAFARVPTDHPFSAAHLLPDAVPQEGLRIARRLERLGLVVATSKRPKEIRVADLPFPRALQGLLRKKPHYQDLVRDSRLLILGLLAGSPEPLKPPEIARRLHLHRNTVAHNLRVLSGRAVLRKTAEGLSIAPHLADLNGLARAFIDHLLQRKLATNQLLRPVLRRNERLIVESDTPQEGLQATGPYRFQVEGADVIAATHQYALTPSDGPTTLQDAFLDAVALNPPPRTKAAIERFMKGR